MYNTKNNKRGTDLTFEVLLSLGTDKRDYVGFTDTNYYFSCIRFQHSYLLYLFTSLTDY